MTFTLDAVAEPLNVPPRVALTATEDDVDLSLQTCLFYRDGVPLRFEAAVTGDQAVAYDYDAPFDQVLVYRADGSELGTLADWTETWASLASWTGSGWAASSGAAASTTPNGVIYRDVTTGSIIEVTVESPSNVTVQVTDADDDVVASVLVSLDGTVTLTGIAVSTVAGSGSFTLALAEDSASVAGTGWSTSVPITGTATRVRLIAPAVVTQLWAVGSSGVGDGQFKNAEGVAVDSAGNIWVADATNNRIQKFDPDGVYLDQFGAGGTADGQFNSPRGIAIDSADNIWVVDQQNNRIQKFDASGAFLLKVGGLASGAGNGQFFIPGDIAVDSSDNVWVADRGNDRIQKFNSAGTFLLKSGSPGTSNGQFSGMGGIAADSSGNVWVVDPGNTRVQKFNSSGVYQSKFGSSGTGDGQLTLFADAIAIDSAGNIWVADYISGSGISRIQKFDSAGAYQTGFTMVSTQKLVVEISGDILVTKPTQLLRFTQADGSVDDITTLIALDEPIEVSDQDTETLTIEGGPNAGAWLMNAATPELALIADAGDCSQADYYLTTDTRRETVIEPNSVDLPIEGSADVVTVPLGPRRHETWTLYISCKTEAARQDLITLLSNSAAILLRFMASQAFLGLSDGFYAVGRVTTVRDEGPAVDPTTVFTLPLMRARAPKYKPLWQWNMNTLAQTGLTMDEVNAAFDSMNDLLIGPN